MSPQAQRIEALLFVAGEAVKKEELASLIGEGVETIDQYIEELSSSLTDHGISLLIQGDYIQLVTSPSTKDYLAQFEREAQALSKAAAETLSIIAYRGPLSRYDVDVLRGVDSRTMIRQLLRRGVIRQIKEAGKTTLYDITEDFLRHLGLTRREDLPSFEDLSNDERLQQILKSSESQS